MNTDMTEREINPFDSLYKTIVFDSKDYSLSKRDVWIYGIVVGWDDECIEELKKKFSWWDDEDSRRLKEMHNTFIKAAKESGAKLYE